MVSLFVEWGTHEHVCAQFNYDSPHPASGGYELFASLVAGMGETTLASVSIMNATTALWYMLPSSITAAAATLVGNSLGGGKTRAAQSAIVMSFIMAMTYGLVNGGLVRQRCRARRHSAHLTPSGTGLWALSGATV